jgi:Rrf2 family cysteine metabolism transcriptional repressor
MQLSCRGRYAARAMFELALNYGQGPLPLSTIATNEGISKKYLNQLMGPLKLAGLVRVVRGKSGGFVLARPPSEIALAGILYAIEGDMSLIDCVKEPSVCDRSGACSSRVIWSDLSHLINNYLQSTTLEDILKKEHPNMSPLG